MKCIIIGLGTYGRVLVDELSALGHEVIAVDNDANRVERVKDMCEAAFQIEATEELSLSVLPLKKVDVVVVAIGQNLGASVRVVALLKKLGVQHIYARAMTMCTKTSCKRSTSIRYLFLRNVQHVRWYARWNWG